MSIVNGLGAIVKRQKHGAEWHWLDRAPRRTSPDTEDGNGIHTVR